MPVVMEATTLANTLESILTGAGTIVTQILSWVGDVASTIITTPLLFVGVGLFVMGAAVSFVRRLLRR